MQKAVELAAVRGREPCPWGEVTGQTQARNLPYVWQWATTVLKIEWFCNVGGNMGQGEGIAKRSAPKGRQTCASFPSRMTLIKQESFCYRDSLTA